MHEESNIKRLFGAIISEAVIFIRKNQHAHMGVHSRPTWMLGLERLINNLIPPAPHTLGGKPRTLGTLRPIVKKTERKTWVPHMSSFFFAQLGAPRE